MRLLLDASALAKRYKKEIGHAAVIALLGSADTVVMAAHCQVEVASSLCREVYEQSIDKPRFDSIMTALAQDFMDFDVRPIAPQIEALAIAAMLGSRLRAMDALHIGTALAARVDLFVTADRKQAQAALVAGLKTELIGAASGLPTNL